MKYVEYIQTDGGCWFDTGLIPTINTKIELTVTPIGSPIENWAGFVGAQNTDDGNSTFQIRNNSGNLQWSARVGNGNGNVGPNYVVGTRYVLTLDRYYLDVDGTQYSTGAYSMDTCNYSLWISAIHNPAWSNGRANAAKFHRLKVWENNVLVGDFRPAVDNNNIGFYDEVTDSLKLNLGSGTPVAGPDLSSISATPSKRRLASTGETISIEVATENAWTLSTSGGSFLTFSSTGDTSGATITATAPDYSGSTPREEYLTFVDSVTSDEASLIITQKKYQSGQPFYLGGDEVAECYVGGDAVVEAYLGEDLVFSTGPLQGLSVTPTELKFNPVTTSASTKVKSSEHWEITSLPAWLSASTMSGDSGETIVTFENISQSADTAETITFSSATFSARVSSSFANIIYTFIEGVRSSNAPYWDLNDCLDTGLYVTADNGTRIRVKYYGTGVFSDRIVGFDSIECGSDDEDFRYFPDMADAADGRINGLNNLYNDDQYYDITFSNLRVFDNINNNTIADSGVYNGVNTSTTIRIDMSVNWIKEVVIQQNNNDHTWSDIADFKAAEDPNGNYGLYDDIRNVWLTRNDLVGTATQPSV